MFQFFLLTTHVHYIAAGGMRLALYRSQSSGAQQVRYLHHDHLSSITEVTNEAGALVEPLAYDPWGKRRQETWEDAIVQIFPQETSRGFTEHEHLDDVSLIHMNGRAYDPDLGRFLSADPYVQSPGNLQNFNRYSYVLNSPVSYVCCFASKTDPGFAFKFDPRR